MENTTITLGKENAIKRLNNYIESLGIDTNSITESSDAVFVKFPQNFKCTPEHLITIQKIFFWNLEVPFSAGLVNFCLSTNSLYVNLAYYEVVTKVFEALQKFGVNLIKFDKEILSLSFSYTLPKRPSLNYDELEIIRTIVNPSRDSSHPLSQMTMHGVTDLSIHIDAIR